MLETICGARESYEASCPSPSADRCAPVDAYMTAHDALKRTKLPNTTDGNEYRPDWNPWPGAVLDRDTVSVVSAESSEDGSPSCGPSQLRGSANHNISNSIQDTDKSIKTTDRDQILYDLLPDMVQSSSEDDGQESSVARNVTRQQQKARLEFGFSRKSQGECVPHASESEEKGTKRVALEASTTRRASSSPPLPGPAFPPSSEISTSGEFCIV